MIYTILLTIHIIAGFSALVAAFVATFTAKGRTWHLYSGRVYFWGMAVIFVTAIPMAIMRPNPFLFLIAIFSFYLALAGWRFAKNRRGKPTRLDWSSAGIMAVTSVAMLGYGVYMLMTGNTMGITLLVFGSIGAALSVFDLITLRGGGVRGKKRIAYHLTGMLAGTIATVTAFIVTNFEFEPEFVLWLAPTVVITPLISWWNAQVMKGKMK
ncbi:MAG: hypothetical protein AAF639_24650 [Chloroflexota bacterium]